MSGTAGRVRWDEVRRRAESGVRAMEAALRGEGPWFERLLDDRTRELARPSPDPGQAAPREAALFCQGRSSCYALSLAGLERVEPLACWSPVPGHGAPILGLTLLGNSRRLLVDLDSLAARLPLREALRPGHAVLLRGWDGALAVDRALGVAPLPADARPGDILEDGCLVVSLQRLAARIMGREEEG